MQTIPSTAPATQTQDDQHLDLLAVFHHILAGLTAFFSCFSLIHLGLGIAMVSGALGGKNPPPPFMGWFFIAMGGVFLLFGWTLAVLMFLAGRNLKRRRSMNFCFIVACVECMMVPFGTVLGVFTLMVLMRPSVKAMFAPGR